MPIITISRGSFSGGKLLAERLAQKLGYRCVDRDHIIEKAAVWGVSQEDLRIAIEKPPTFLGQSQHTKYLYLALIQAALTEELRTGNAIYHGLAGHLLLGKGPHVLRTRIIAPMDFRIAQVQEFLRCNRKEAVAYIDKIDADRRKWTQFLYGVDWSDGSLYDIVLNLEQLDLEAACDVIAGAAQQQCFATSAQSRKAMDDLELGSRVRAHLAMHPATSTLEFEVVAQGGVVAIKGGLDSPDQAKKVAAIVRAIPGVSTVHLEQLALATRI